MNITQYKDGNKSVKMLSVNDLVETMKDSASGHAVKEFRKKLEEYPPGSPCPAAAKLPRIVFGAELKKKKEAIEMMAYNGLILLEVDNLTDYREAMEIRRKAIGSLQTLLAFIGSSRKSVKIVVPFTLPDGSLPSNRELAERFHAHAYQLALNYYRMQLQREIPYRQPTVVQACRISYDPDLYYNPAAVPVTLEQPLQMPGEPTFRELKQQEPDDATADALLVRLAENCLRAGIPEEDVVKWSYANMHFQRKETELRAAVHNAYLLDKYYGVGPAMPACQNLVLRMEEFMKRRYELRRNELKGEVEYRERRSYYYSFFPVTDEVLNTISLHVQEEGLDLWDRDVKRYIYSNKIALFNPLDDYLDHLPE